MRATRTHAASKMERRVFVAGLASILAVPLATEAQQAGKAYRIGILHVIPPDASRGFEALRQGLRSLGYVDGQNIGLEYRWSERPESLSTSVMKLLRLKVHVIVTADATIAAVAKRATSDTPIVMASSGDPVTEGLVTSLARPGGNIPGLSSLSPQLSGKRLELLKETLPAVSRIAVLWNAGFSGSALSLKMTEQAARRLHVELQRIESRGLDDVDNAFQSAARSGAGAVIVLSAPGLDRFRAQIARLALKHRLPAMASAEGFAKAGGLVQYGASITDNWRRAATYVDKILKGAKPGDLPVEQPTTFELVINLKTAKTLGLTIPPSLLLRADQVIE
jgi:putative tryptophan/tyrosine transport system substrate-binding protein